MSAMTIENPATEEKTEREVDTAKREDDRPQHLADAVLESYLTRTKQRVGSAFEGGKITRIGVVCINGTDSRSRWRVQCYTTFDGPLGDRALARPSSVVWVDAAGEITEFCKA